MIKELRKTLSEISRDKSFFIGGDFWLPIIVACIYFYCEKFVGINFNIEKILGDIVSMLSILIGFSITNIVFQMQIIAKWRSEIKFIKISDKIMRWTIYPLIILIFTLLYVIVLDILLSAEPFISHKVIIILESFLVFFSIYSISQVLCQVLNVWWIHKNRNLLNEDNNNDKKIINIITIKFRR